MRMEKRKFRIGELAQNLEIERFVIRFWEKEFNIKAQRSPGGQRFYDENDLKKFQTIKRLLYEEKFTIAGAKKMLKKIPVHKHTDADAILASHVTTLEKESYSTKADKDILLELRALREQLNKLSQLI